MCSVIRSSRCSSKPALSGLTFMRVTFRCGLVDDRLVDELPQLRPNVVRARGDELRHENDAEVLDRVDPERRAGQTSPVELALTADHLVGGRVEDDGEAQAEPDSVHPSLGEDRAPERLQV